MCQKVVFLLVIPRRGRSYQQSKSAGGTPRFLNDKKADFELIEYLKDEFTVESLTSVIAQLKIPAESLVRKGESIFKESFKGKDLSEKEWIEAMVQYPKLIERPIVVLNNHAVIARPTEKIDDLK